ncbi:MAG: hypothetical protein IJM71_07310 [Clostridia bacterium]|nr:hypothetical protein [Clostridia bacterium]
MENNNIVRNAVEFLLFNYFGLDRDDRGDRERIIDKAIELAYWDATSQGAFNTLFTKTEFPDREAVNDFLTRVKGMSCLIKDGIMALYFSDVKIDFDEWHRGICLELVTEYKKICQELNSPTFRSDPKAFEFFSYGNAQKWVNMTMKNLYVISGAYLALGGEGNEELFNAVAARSDEYHIPLDNLILGTIYKQKLIGNDKNYFVVKYGKKDPSYQIAYGDEGTDDSISWSNIGFWSIYKTFRKDLEDAIKEPPIEWECRNWIERKKRIKELKGDLTTIDD